MDLFWLLNWLKVRHFLDLLLVGELSFEALDLALQLIDLKILLLNDIFV